MARQPHQHQADGTAPKRSHHRAKSTGTPGTVHPQREYVANHLRKVAAGVEQSAVAHEPLTPTERHAMRAGLKHAREHVAPTPG